MAAPTKNLVFDRLQSCGHFDVIRHGTKVHRISDAGEPLQSHTTFVRLLGEMNVSFTTTSGRSEIQN